MAQTLSVLLIKKIIRFTIGIKQQASQINFKKGGGEGVIVKVLKEYDSYISKQKKNILCDFMYIKVTILLTLTNAN